MITLTSKGSFSNTEAFLKKQRSAQIQAALQNHGAAGVAALSAMTPADTGATASSWSFSVVQKGTHTSLIWTNSHKSPGGGPPVAIMLQYGHGTGTGGYVQGRDFIMPAIQPVFDKIATEVWKEVTK